MTSVFQEKVHEIDHRIKTDALDGIERVYDLAKGYARSPCEHDTVGLLADRLSYKGIVVERPKGR